MNSSILDSVTSRLEGAHRIVKLWISSSTKDLKRAWDAVSLMIKDQLNKMRQKLARQLASAPANLTGPIYHAHLGKITHHGLYLFHAQYALVNCEQQRTRAIADSTNRADSQSIRATTSSPSSLRSLYSL